MADNPLQKAPQGLLELYQLKTLGAQPSLFGELVSPTTDVTDFYSSQTSFTAQTANAAAAMGGTVSVPANFLRLWRTVSCSIVVGAAAGTRLRLRIGLRCPSVASSVVILADQSFTPVAAQAFSVSYSFPRPTVLPPGAQFLGVSIGDAAGADHVLSMESFSDSYQN